MKNQLFTLFAAAAVLFLIGCKGNPTESPEYQQMMADYQAGIKANTELQAAHVAMQKEGQGMMAQIAAMEGEEMDSLKNALTASMQAMSAKHGQTMQGHAATITSHSETIKAHAAGDVTMESLKADFEKIKTEQQAIADDYAAMKAEHEAMKSEVEAAMTAASEGGGEE